MHRYRVPQHRGYLLGSKHQRQLGRCLESRVARSKGSTCTLVRCAFATGWQWCVVCESVLNRGWQDSVQGSWLSKEADAMPVYQLRIKLRGMSPPVWRRIVIDAEASLASLHEGIQRSMGWEGDYQHRFMIRGRCFNLPQPGGVYCCCSVRTLRRFQNVADNLIAPFLPLLRQHSISAHSLIFAHP